MANSKPVKQEVNGTVILSPLVFPGSYYRRFANNTTAFGKKNLQTDYDNF